MLKINNQHSDWTVVTKNNKPQKSLEKNVVANIVQEQKVKTVFANIKPQESTVNNVYANPQKIYGGNNVTKTVALNFKNKNSNTEHKNTDTIKTKKDLYYERLNLIKSVIMEACIPEDDLLTMIDEFYDKKEIDKKTGTFITHLRPLLLPYYDNNENRYPALSSQKFRDEVNQYYSDYDCIVKIINDADNEVWKIFIYPQ